jgi:hypothetical protein
MIKNRTLNLGAVAVLMLVTSCTIYKDIPIEILRTPESVLPTGQNQIALLYRNFKYTNDTLLQYYRDDEVLKKDKIAQKINSDSIVVLSCLNKVAQLFAEKEVCSQPVIFPVDMMPRIQGGKLNPIPPDLIKKLASSAQTGYVISLETYTYFFVHYSVKTQANESQHVAMAGIWTLYNGNSGVILERKSMTDTVFWDSEAATVTSGAEKLPPRLPALQLAAETFGENFASRFYQEWIKVDRLLIVPPLEEFRQAAEFAGEQKWDKASAIWQKYSDDHYGRLAVTACYNLALACEIRDDLATALRWITQAFKLASVYKDQDEMRMVRSYKQILTQRSADIEKFSKSGS